MFQRVNLPVTKRTSTTIAHGLVLGVGTVLGTVVSYGSKVIEAHYSSYL